MESVPLQIKTDSEFGSDEKVGIYFFAENENDAGGIILYFTSPPQYQLSGCSTSETDFSGDLPTEADKIWTLALQRNSEDPRLVVTCNEKEILNVVLSETSCDNDDWSNQWSRDVEWIKFKSFDTASDFYRASEGENSSIYSNY